MGYESKEDGQQSTVISKKNELTVREASKLISSDLIEAYDYVLYGFAGADIKAVSPDENTSSIGTVSTGGDQPEFRLVGNTDLELMEDFSSNTKKLVQGRIMFPVLHLLSR